MIDNFLTLAYQDDLLHEDVEFFGHTVFEKREVKALGETRGAEGEPQGGASLENQVPANAALKEPVQRIASQCFLATGVTSIFSSKACRFANNCSIIPDNYVM